MIQSVTRPLLVAERQMKIANLIQQKGSERVSELSKLFQVTEETIRRDLEKLENDGTVMRTHGGAVSTQHQFPEQEIPYQERETIHHNEKIRIAECALSLISPGDTLMLDPSTTVKELVSLIPNIPLTVITTSLAVASELSSKDQIQVIVVGGNLISKSMSLVGPLCEYGLKQYYVNKLFLSCHAVHIDNGLSEATEQQALIKKCMIKRADQIVLLSDSSKFGKQSLSLFGKITDVTRVITDSRVPSEQLKLLQKLGIQTQVAELND